jgi:hypothetical protein
VTIIKALRAMLNGWRRRAARVRASVMFENSFRR